MKIYFPCRQCNAENLYTEYIVNDTGFYEGICVNGHKSKVYAQDQLFEVLFEIGVAAIKDGYYREAISSFVTSLERLYEFYIRAVFLKRHSSFEFSKIWKKVSNQSERQLGAFIFLYTLENGKIPELLTNREVEFRNEVIHKGKIPKPDECIDFGQKVLNIMYEIIENLKSNFSNEIEIMVDQHLKNLSKQYGQLSDGVAWTMTVSLVNEGRTTMESALDNLDLIGH